MFEDSRVHALICRTALSQLLVRLFDSKTHHVDAAVLSTLGVTQKIPIMDRSELVDIGC